MFIKNQKFKTLQWTEHSKIKMRQYGLSKQKISGILRNPERIEQAIVPGLTAAMKTNKKFVSKQPKNPPKANAFRRASAPGEIWVMYKDKNPSASSGQATRKIISAWRYPGVTKPGDEIPIPEDIKTFIKSV